MTNNYESVDFDECRSKNASSQGSKKTNQKPIEYTAETFAVYSIQENNIYEDERYDDFSMDTISKPKTRFDREEAENNNYIAPVSTHNNTHTHTLTSLQSMNKSANNIAKHNKAATTSTSTMTTAEQIYNTSQRTSPPSIYSVKYLVDLNDLKQHLNCDNCHSTKTLCHHAVSSTAAASSSQTDALCSAKNIYELQPQLMSGGVMASNTNLLDAESIYCKTPGVQTRSEATLSRRDSRGRRESSDANRGRRRRSGPSACCCLHACFSFFYLISKIFKCFKVCCCAPCCSTAALLGAFGAIGGLLAGFAFMGVFGIIPIPMELTRLICNASEPQKFYYYNNNLTIIKEIGNFSFPPGYRPADDFNGTRTRNGWANGSGAAVETRAAFKIEKKPSETDEIETSRKMFAALNKNASIRLKAYNKYKNMIARLIPLTYNVVLTPSKPNADSFKSSSVASSAALKSNPNGMEMKIDMIVRMFCNHSTNQVHVLTKEFINIELSIVSLNDEANQIKRWKHDLDSGVLEIETIRNCTQASLYELRLSIAYKNFGTVYTFEKSPRQIQTLSIASFIQGFENPFPLVVEVHSQAVNERLYVVSPGPSVFNITLARKRQTQNMICNMDVLKKSEKGSLEYVYFKSSPLLHPYFVTFLFGDFNCKETEDLTDFSVKMRICWLSNMEPSSEVFSLMGEQTRLLFDHLSAYTKKDYQLDKLDIVVMPRASVKSLLSASHDPKTTSIGLVFIADAFTTNLEHYDYLNKLKLKFKITSVLAKQLAKYWFYTSNDFHCETSLLTPTNENDLFEEKIASIRALCLSQNCTQRGGNKSTSSSLLGRSVFADLQIFHTCMLYKAIVNWISYLAFQTVYPDLFDLLKLEWSLIKEVDSNYFLDSKNINHIYENYEFPILAESTSFKNIKSEIKSLELVKAIYLIVGEEKFQNLVRDWFKLVDESIQHRQEAFHSIGSIRNGGKNNSVTTKTSILKRYPQGNGRNSTIFTHLQQDLNINDILTSWALTENDVIVNFERNYNKKEATFKISSINKPPLIDIFYPFNWCHGSIEINFKKRITIDDKQPPKTIWLNQTTTKIASMPGADQWVIGNSMDMFGLLRVNYDHQNWLMLTERLRYDFESIGVNERAQIIDDVFYLVNNQLMPISYGLNLLEYISKENRYLPWKYAIKHIKTILDFVEDHSQIYAKFRQYVINLVKPMYKRLQWGENYLDTFDEKLIRILVVDLMCSLDHDDCVENSVKQLTDIIKINVNNIPDYLTKIIYCTAIRHTSIKEWQYLFEVYLLAPETSNLKQTTLFSLTCSSQVWILNMLFDQLVYDNSLSPTDLQVLIGYITKNPAGKYVVWNHISQNYQAFYDKIGNDPDLLVKLVQVATVGFKLKYEIKQVYNFMEEAGLAASVVGNGVGSVNNVNANLAFSKEKLFVNIESRIARFAQWKTSNANDLDNWLKKKLSTTQI